jgi:hypothetical protein
MSQRPLLPAYGTFPDGSSVTVRSIVADARNATLTVSI